MGSRRRPPGMGEKLPARVRAPDRQGQTRGVEARSVGACSRSGTLIIHLQRVIFPTSVTFRPAKALVAGGRPQSHCSFPAWQ